jgi:hypothetical protein
MNTGSSRVPSSSPNKGPATPPSELQLDPIPTPSTGGMAEVGGGEGGGRAAMQEAMLRIKELESEVGLLKLMNVQ